jgi:hypothetical protein
MNDKIIQNRWWGWIIKLGMILLVVKATTCGWRLSVPYSLSLSIPQEKTVSHLQETVRMLAEQIGPRNYMTYGNLNKAASYIVSRFQELGYEVETMSYPVNHQRFKNIIAQKSGNDHSNEVLIIGAHYDSCFNPGADDNASGVAALLELARLLKDEKYKTRIKFVAFVNEEPPFFRTEAMGSRVYVSKVKEEGEKIIGAIILEMIGYYSKQANSQRYLPLLGPFYPNKADFIAVVGNFPSRELVSKLVSGFKESSDFPIESLIAPNFIPGLNFSDHASFWEEGFPAMMITDTAYMRNPHYHQASDLPETLNYEKMSLLVHGLQGAILQLDKEVK